MFNSSINNMYIFLRNLKYIAYLSLKSAAALDKYIRNGLFSCSFNSMINNNWKVLISYEADILRHILKELMTVIFTIHEKVFNSHQIDTSIDFDAARCLSIGVSYGYGGNDYKNSDFTAI